MRISILAVGSSSSELVAAFAALDDFEVRYESKWGGTDATDRWGSPDIVFVTVADSDELAAFQTWVPDIACPIVAVVPFGMLPLANDCSAAGADQIIFQPEPARVVRDIAKQVLTGKNFSRQRQQTIANWRRDFAPHLVGFHPRFVRLLDTVSRVAPTDCDVLINGPSGTGKELIARAIHNASGRTDGVFVAINCAAIPGELVESEIFGCAKGAFTGAFEARRGKFESADKGTFFLDEVGELDPALQGKFLRVLQEREFSRVGETEVRRVDARLVSATNADLEEHCRIGKFREDLYYRLNVVPLALPSLKERWTDIPGLLACFLERANRRYGRNIQTISLEALEILLSYPWPGNVRELGNVVERIVVLAGDTSIIEPNDLPSRLHDGRQESGSLKIALPDHGIDINDALTQVEMQLTLDAMRRAKGNKARAAQLLGLKRTTLVERLKKLDIEEEYRT